MPASTRTTSAIIVICRRCAVKIECSEHIQEEGCPHKSSGCRRGGRVRTILLIFEHPLTHYSDNDGKWSECADYKLTVNQVAKTDVYPIPRIEDLFASLEKGQKFTKLDLKDAYAQVPLSDEANKYTKRSTAQKGCSSMLAYLSE